MPRKARKYVNASFFHVMCQGIKKENIFSKESHIKRYLYLINKYKIDPFIVYGGSVRNNIKEMLEIKNIKGVMIGKISSDIKEITKILSNI